jgi:endonuclease/exonuclease/phosphatase family metal-dependent hydrolase
MTWNLEWFPGRVPEPTREQEQTQMREAQAALAALQPDVLLLQEVRNSQVVTELCRVVPGLQPQVVSDFGVRPQNQAVASRIPADSAWAKTWKAGAVEPPRGYAFAAVPLPGRRFLLLYSLHLKSNLGEEAANVAMRSAAAGQLLEHAREMLALYGRRGACAVIIGGDLNTSLDDPRFQQEPTLPALRAAGLHWTHEGVPFSQRTTIPRNDRFPDNCFDHILTLGLGRAKARVKSLPQVSDHNPVIVDLDLSRAEFRGGLDLAAAETLLRKTSSLAPAQEEAGVLRAADDPAIRAAVGKLATVQGSVARFGLSNTGGLTFINFAGTERGQFTAIIRKENLARASGAFGGDLPAALLGKTVQVRGKISLFQETPQIDITRADQLTLVR